MSGDDLDDRAQGLPRPRLGDAGRARSAHRASSPSVAYEEDIRQSIRIILETAPGERVMRPNFGCGIHELVFAALDSTTMQRIRSVVEEALRRCEARIEVLGVTVDEAATREGQLLVELEYRVRKTNQIGNLVFPFYFREGGRP